MAQTQTSAEAPPKCPRDPPADLPKPGEVKVYDFRSEEVKRLAQAAKNTIKQESGKPVKIIQWNIERGYKLPQIIEELKSIDADVLALQEIDIHCERSNWEDTGVAIAKALGLQYAFLCEFEELWSPVREADAQGGGVHGNAILSKYDITDLRVVKHSHHPIDWEHPDHPLCKKEPRHGERLTLGGTVHTPQGPLLVYSVHLEVFCGMLARMRQYADVVRDVREVDAAGGPRHQVICGDLNTQANSLARLSANYCTDRMRWRTLGWFEAEVWDRHVFGCMADPERPDHHSKWLAGAGLDVDSCKALANPGFKDPWNPRRDVTIDLHKYRWFGLRLMTGKLDWVLTRNMSVISKAMGNDEYDKSDHKWLLVEVQFDA